MFDKFYVKDFFQKNIFFLFTLFIISTLIRIKINFSTEFISGNNGAYYLILNRTLIEKGTLVYKEFPLLFYLQSIIALIPIKLNLLPTDQAIDFVSRFFDSVIPPLSIFPAYFIVNKISTRKQLIKIGIATLSIFHFVFFILISDFQKNSLGLVWLFWLLYFLIRLNEKYNIRNIVGVLIFFVLTGLTHFGCFGIAIYFVLINLIINLLYDKSFSKLFKILLIAFSILILSFTMVYIISPWRFESLLNIVKTIFLNPIIIKVLNNQPIISPLDLFEMVLVNAIAIMSLVIIIKKKYAEHKKYILLVIIVSFTLSSPFLNIEIAQRLYFISYITMIPLFSFLIENLNPSFYKNVVFALVVVLNLFSTLFGITKPVYSNMNKNIYANVLKMRESIPEEKRILIVARHGLEYWLKWILRIDTIREDELTTIYWKWYKDIYYVHQKKDKPPFGPAGIFGEMFPEPTIPKNGKLIFSNEYFDLYK